MLSSTGVLLTATKLANDETDKEVEVEVDTLHPNCIESISTVSNQQMK